MTFTVSFKSKNEMKAVFRAARAAGKKNIIRQGALVRKIARQSIRRTKKSSKPGDPPRAHIKGNTGIKLIYFKYDPSNETVVVGPLLYQNASGKRVLEGLEYGVPTLKRLRDGRMVVQRSKARPFMRPALQKSIEKVPSLWKNSVR